MSAHRYSDMESPHRGCHGRHVKCTLHTNTCGFMASSTTKTTQQQHPHPTPATERQPSALQKPYLLSIFMLRGILVPHFGHVMVGVAGVGVSNNSTTLTPKAEANPFKVVKVGFTFSLPFSESMPFMACSLISILLAMSAYFICFSFAIRFIFTAISLNSIMFVVFKFHTKVSIIT